MTGLKKLELHLSGDEDRHHNRTNIASWPRLTKLSITVLAIGGYDLIILVMARAKVTDLTLNCIKLLDGTWEGVIEGLCHIRGVTELHLVNYFKHRGGQMFAPHETISGHSDPQLLRAVEDL